MRVKLRVVKAIIKFPFMCRHVGSVGVGLVLKVSSIQVNMLYYLLIDDHALCINCFITPTSALF